MFTDRFATAYFEDMVKRHGIRTVVETGTFRGDSTLCFAERVEHVITIELNEEYYAAALSRLQRPNIQCLRGNSPEVLSSLRNFRERCCFLLDAHWYDYWPLLDELRAIRSLCAAGVLSQIPAILIHDFKVPGHPELGFDTYHGQALDWDYVKAGVLAICDKYDVTYNDRAEGNNRGILRLEPPS
jgi:hypothetical protein